MINIVDIDRIVVSKRFLVNRILNILQAIKVLKNRPLCIVLPKMSAGRRDFDKTKCMSFLIKDGKFLGKYEI